MEQKLIHTDPDIMDGTPVFSGTRVPVHSLFEWLETETLDEFLANFPSVSRDQALEVLRQAEKAIIGRRPYNENTT